MQVEGVSHDQGVGEHEPDHVPVGVVAVHGHHLHAGSFVAAVEAGEGQMAAPSRPGATSMTTPRSGSENTVAKTKGLRTAHSSMAKRRPRRRRLGAVARARARPTARRR